MHNFGRTAVTALLFFCAIPVSAQPSKKIRINPVTLGFDLPESYRQRTFIKGLAGFVNNIDQLVGSMVLIDGNSTSVLTRFVKQDKPPVITTSTSDILYSAKIDSKFKFNGSYAIASTKVAKDHVVEMVITDIAVAFLPEDYIPYVEICRASGNVSPATRASTYYIRSAKLTTVYTRSFEKTSGDAAVNGICFSVGGEVYNSSDHFKVDYVVSVDIVSLERLLSLHNCNQLINNEELARREKAEKARLEALKADEERKNREQELAAAKAQVDELKRILTHNIERSEAMQQELMAAQDREKAALEQLNHAIQQADDLSDKARKEQKEADRGESLVVTFKNKEGKVLEIKSLEELSPEKLKEMGFDVEVLKSPKY